MHQVLFLAPFLGIRSDNFAVAVFKALLYSLFYYRKFFKSLKDFLEFSFYAEHISLPSSVWLISYNLS